MEVRNKMSEITIGQYERYLEVYFDSNLNDLEKKIKSLSIFYNATEDEIEELTPNDFRAYMVKLSLINFWVKKVKNTVVLNGKTYKSNTKTKTPTLTVREVYTIKGLIENKIEITPSLLASVLFREVQEDGTLSTDFSLDKLRERQEVFKTMPMEHIIPFLNLDLNEKTD
jgi:hypothetical protein